jgi:membrane-associated protease RseP (regulator of RpoE activity)
LLKAKCYEKLSGRFAIRKKYWINILLFLITCITTTLAGAVYVNGLDSWSEFFAKAWRGWVFSVPLMLILVVHEMGHFLTGKRHHLDVTPPYFLPAIPPIGTFGAFIKIRSPITNLRTLVEVGASGPIAGALVAIPMLMVGLYFSEIREIPPDMKAGMDFGSSIILELSYLIRFGQSSSNATVLLHPTAIAAWFGLFVTAMNLLPIGQLDGGHVMYALFGRRRAKMISVAVLCILIPLGIFLWPGWIVFGTLAFFLGLNHPPPLDSYSPLDKTGRIIGWTAIILFVLTFIPVPISVME